MLLNCRLQQLPREGGSEEAERRLLSLQSSLSQPPRMRVWNGAVLGVEKRGGDALTA